MEPLPDSAIAREAEGLLRDSSSPSLVNHCLRSYLWAVGLAGVDGLAFDSELLFVAAALHDLGLEPAFDSGAPFEVDGGRVAAAMATEHGWVDPAAQTVERAIVLHVAPNVTPDDGVEAYLLNESTGTDVSGHRLDELDQSWISAVMTQFPRLQFTAEFGDLFVDQAARKPPGRAAALVAAGLRERRAGCPLTTFG